MCTNETSKKLIYIHSELVTWLHGVYLLRPQL